MGAQLKVVNPKNKMKLTPAVLFAVAAAEEKKVPPQHPLQRLNKLVTFSTELFNEQKCGYYDANNLPHGGPNGDRKRRELEDVERYNREDPWEGTKQITTGFRKWAERYIAGCNGQANHQHQVTRFRHYYGLMIEALDSQE